DDGSAVLFHGLGHGHGHATVLERAGRVEAFVFHVDVDILAEQLRDVLQANQRRVAFTEADDRGVIVYRQVVTVAVDQACVTLAKVHGFLSVNCPPGGPFVYDFNSSTRMRTISSTTVSSAAIFCSAWFRSASRTAWVIIRIGTGWPSSTSFCCIASM